MSFSINRTNNKIVKKTVSLTSNPTINTNVFEETYQIVSSTNSIITLPNNSNNNSNYYNNWYIKILSGNGINQIRQIQSYNSINKQLTLKTNLEIIPSSNDSIILYNKLNSNIIWQESNNRFAPVFMKNSSNLNQMGETVDYLDFGCNNLIILSNKQSHSTSSGSLIVNGGAGITGTVNIGNSLNVTNSISCNNLSVNGISITGNLSNVYLTDIVPGTASISKALVLNSSGNISGINSLTSTNILVTNFTLNGTLLTASGSEINKLTGTTAVTSDFNKLASVTSTAAEINYLDLTTGPGIAEISKALVLNSSGNISGINSLTSTNILVTNFTLNGTLLTASGSEINKLTGTTAVTSDFNKLASVTASATEINYLSGLTLGTISANKSITVDSSSNINSILRLKKITNNQQIYFENGTSTGSIYHYLNGTIVFGSISSNELSFQTNNIIRLTITSSGLMNILGGWQISGTTVTTTAAEINYLDLTTGPGTAEISKALVLNSSGNISGINSLTSTNLLATNFTLNGTLLTASGAELNKLTSTTAVTSDFNKLASVTASATEINKLTGTTAVTSDFNKLASVTASATELNYLAGLTLGTITASKSITVDSSSNINSILRLKKTVSGQQIYLENGTSTGTIYHDLNGSIYLGTISANNLIFQTQNTNRVTITSAGLMNILGGWQISGATVTSSAAEINYLDFSTGSPGTAESNKALILNTDRDISNIRKITLNGTEDVLTLSNSTTSARINLRFINDTKSWELGSRGSTASNSNSFYLYDNQANSYRLIVDSDGDVNIVSHNGSTTGLQLNGSLVTATAAELNILDGVTATTTELNYLDITSEGNAQANKALILNTDRDISNIRNLTATNLTGTLQTTAQTNITSVGTLSSLTSSGNIIISNANAAFRTLAHSDNIIYLQAGLNTTAGSSADIFIGNYGQDIAGSSRKIIFKGNGRLGLGTANPQSLLDFGQNATDSTINLYTHGTTNETFKIGANGSLIKYQSGSSAGHAWYTGSTTTSTGTESMRLNNLNALSVNTSNANAIMNILGSSNYVDNSYNKVLRCSGANASPVNIEIQCHSGSSTTSTNAGWIGTVSNNDLRLGANSTTFFTIKANGNIGINNTNPGYKLDINGSYWATGGEIHTGTNWSNNGLHHSAYGDDNVLYRLISKGYVLYPGGPFQHQFGASGNTSLEFLTNNTSRMFISNSGNVGIKTSSPSYLLDVSGTINSSSVIRSSNYMYVSDSGNYGRYIGNWTGTGYWGIGAHSSNQVRIGTCDSTGNWTGYANTYMGAVYASNTISLTLGTYAYYTAGQNIGGTSSTLTNNYAGYFAGRIACNGELNVVSDYRSKNNIEQLSSDYCKNFINNTTPVKFNYNNDQSQNHFGYIAQDVYKAGFTDLVALCPQEGLDEIIEEDGFVNPKDIAFVMSTNEIIPILAKNIKIIYQENEEQKNKISNLENENQQLKDQIQNILLRLQNLENN